MPEGKGKYYIIMLWCDGYTEGPKVQSISQRCSQKRRGVMSDLISCCFLMYVVLTNVIVTPLLMSLQPMPFHRHHQHFLFTLFSHSHSHLKAKEWDNGRNTWLHSCVLYHHHHSCPIRHLYDFHLIWMDGIELILIIALHCYVCCDCKHFFLFHLEIKWTVKHSKNDSVLSVMMHTLNRKRPSG